MVQRLQPTLNLGIEAIKSAALHGGYWKACLKIKEKGEANLLHLIRQLPELVPERVRKFFPAALLSWKS